MPRSSSSSNTPPPQQQQQHAAAAAAAATPRRSSSSSNTKIPVCEIPRKVLPQYPLRKSEAGDCLAANSGRFSTGSSPCPTFRV